MTVTDNYGIVPAAMHGKNARNGTGSFSTDAYRPDFTRYGLSYTGHLPQRLRDILNARFR